MQMDFIKRVENRMTAKPSLLVVDDLDANLYSMKKMLEPLDVEVFTASSAMEGLRILLNDSVDVLILDYSMPHMNGAEMSQAIHNQFKEPPPILFVTAHGHSVPGLEQLCYDNGAIDFVEKPVNESIFLAKLKVLLSLTSQKKQLTQLASTDHLTGLLNRFSFQSILEQSLAVSQRQSNIMALLSLDLDRFKEVNDLYGHDAGDAVLKTFSKRLKSTLRTSDAAARMGGDEFSVLLTNLNTSDEAEMIAQKILTSCAADVSFNGLKLPFGVSIGIAFYPSHASDVTQLKKASDVALYKAKGAGRDCFRLFSNEKNVDSDYFEENLQLKYQPIISSNSMEVVGVEILTEVLGSERYGGMKEAIDHFRKIGQIRYFEEALCKKLSKDIGKLPEGATKGFKLFLNQNIQELIHGEHVRDLLQLNDMLQKQNVILVIELDGWERLNSKNNFLKPLNILAAGGVELCFQDVGTKAIPTFLMESLCLSYVKLAMQLVSLISIDKVSRAIGESICNIAEQTGSHVIAVGVESQTQYEELKKIGIKEFQGFLWEGALTIEELNTKYFLNKSN
jgi:diguanylate cyclase